MKIYDCFSYWDEDLLLDLRLNILNEYVDYFVIVEGNKTWQNNSKKLRFNLDNFKKFKDKIIYILVDELPDGLYDIEKQKEKDKANRTIDNTLKIEHNQRNKISEGLKSADENDLIIVSDVDEIPKLNFFKSEEIKNNILIFEQKMFYYKFDLVYDGFKWHGSKATQKMNFVNAQWLRDIKPKNYPKWRIDTFFSKKKYSNLKFIKDGGWHFTNMRSPKELHFKFMNFGHHVEYKESGLDVNKIQNIIGEKKVLYDHNVDKTSNKWNVAIDLKRVEHVLLPDYLINNKLKYKSWFDN